MYKTCEICGKSFHYESGWFTTHLLNNHSITLKEYILIYDLHGIKPICDCGYCKEEPPFVRGRFLKTIKPHKSYNWKKDQYIKLYGIPICITCKRTIKSWNRGVPSKYCSHKCIPSSWNQITISNTVKTRYNVNNVFQLPEIREASRKRMLFNNPMLNKASRDKISKASAEHAHTGKHFKNITKQYKHLYYQSKLEFDFIQLCESLNIIDRLKNGHCFKYSNDAYGIRFVNDFSIDDYEIEIKSAYILQIQGGIDLINARKKVIGLNNKKYMFILDKNYNEFLKVFGKSS